MKYDDNLVYNKHYGGFQVFIYDIDDYRFCVMYATGSSVSMYNKEDAPLDTIKNGNPFGWIDNKSISHGWWYMNETVDEAIDRHLHKLKHPNQLIWYENRKPNGCHYSHNRIRYTDDNDPTTIAQVEMNPNFNSWYNKHESIIQKDK